MGADGFPILASPAEQARMQAYADALYDRRAVRASVTDAAGAPFDCIDFDAQPACRDHGCPHLTPPTPPPPPGGAAAVTPAQRPSGGLTCPAGTIGIRRPSVETMRHFRTLEEWLHPPKGAPPRP